MTDATAGLMSPSPGLSVTHFLKMVLNPADPKGLINVNMHYIIKKRYIDVRRDILRPPHGTMTVFAIA